MVDYNEFDIEFDRKIRNTQECGYDWVEHIKSKLPTLDTKYLQYMLTNESMSYSYWSSEVLDEVKYVLEFRLNTSLEEAIRGCGE